MEPQGEHRLAACPREGMERHSLHLEHPQGHTRFSMSKWHEGKAVALRP